MSFDSKEYERELDTREPKGLSSEHREIAKRVRDRYSDSPSEELVQITQASDGRQERPSTTRSRPDPNVNRGPWCVQCGVEKLATNHWYEVSTDGNFFVLQGMGRLASPGWRPLCGQACVHAEVVQFMNGQSPTLGA